MERTTFIPNYISSEMEHRNSTIMPPYHNIPFTINYQTMTGQYDHHSKEDNAKNDANSCYIHQNIFYNHLNAKDAIINHQIKNKCLFNERRDEERMPINNSEPMFDSRPVLIPAKHFETVASYPNHLVHSDDPLLNEASKMNRKLSKDKPKRVRRKVADPSAWKRNISRLQKCDGKPYVNYKGIEQPAKHPKLPNCRNCRFHCPQHFSEEVREKLCSDFWKLALYNRQRDYLIKYIKVCKPQRPRKNVAINKQRKCARSYFLLKKKGVLVRVCKSFFERTLCISNGPIELSLQNNLTSNLEQYNTNNSNVSPDCIKNISKSSFLCIDHKIEKLTKSKTKKLTNTDKLRRNVRNGPKKEARFNRKEIDSKKNETLHKTMRKQSRLEEIINNSSQHSHNEKPENNKLNFHNVLPNKETEIQNLNNRFKSNYSTHIVGIINNADHINQEQSSYEIRQRRMRRKVADPTCWKRNLTKQLKTEGKPYRNSRGVLLPGKVPQPIDCQTCRFQCSEKFSGGDRKAICSSFWKLSGFQLQKEFILKYVKETEPQRQRKNVPVNKRRKCSRSYFFQKIYEIDLTRVCKTFFERTLCISNGPIELAFKNSLSGLYIGEDKRGKKEPVNKTKPEDVKFVLDHIKKYRKANWEEYKDSTTLMTITKFYAAYAQECRTRNRSVVSMCIYRKIYHNSCRKSNKNASY